MRRRMKKTVCIILAVMMVLLGMPAVAFADVPAVEQYTGAGMKIAIIDVGFSPDHEAFAEESFLYSLAANASAAGIEYDDYVASLDLFDADDIREKYDDLNLKRFISEGQIDDVCRSAKLPFVFNYAGKGLDMSKTTSNHGSHVSGIAGANKYVKRGETFVKAFEETHLQGKAPDAQLFLFDVSNDEGVISDKALLYAIEDAIALGCDVINTSLGAYLYYMGKRTTLEGYHGWFQLFEDNDVQNAISAGNFGSWDVQNGLISLYADEVSLCTLVEESCYEEALAVASAINPDLLAPYFKISDREYVYDDATLFDGGSLPALCSLIGEGLTDEDFDYVYVDAYGKDGDFEAVKAALEEAGDSFDSKIAISNRGEVNFTIKSNNAIKNGALVSLIVNTEDGILGAMLTDYEYDNPVAACEHSAGNGFKELASSSGTAISENGTINYYIGTMTLTNRLTLVSNERAKLLADTSSWGTPSVLMLKPEITAFGENIYSVSGLSEDNQDYMNMSGTSMASPQVAGMIATIAGELKDSGKYAKAFALSGFEPGALATSLLMSTAEQISDETGEIYPVFAQGAGLADLEAALDADCFIKMGENTSVMGAENRGKVKVELGEDPERIGAYSFNFDICNTSSTPKTFNLSGDFFTQNVYEDGGKTYLSRTTAPLASTVTFTGTEVDSENARVTVPAESAAEIICNVTLTNIADFDYSGAYVEGFIYASGGSEHHSIPVLGYYGSWSEPSMFDRATIADAVDMVNGRVPEHYPHLLEMMDNFYSEDYELDTMFTINNAVVVGAADQGVGNFLGYDYAAEDGVYLEDRVSLNSKNRLEGIASLLIRNAAVGKVTVENSTGEILKTATGEMFYAINSAWVFDSIYAGAYLNSKGLDIYLNYSLAGQPNGEKITVTTKYVPALYVARYDDLAHLTDEQWAEIDSKLTGGAIHRISFYVDNERPTVSAIDLTTTPGSLTVTASDNRFISGMKLYNAAGTSLVATCGSIKDPGLLPGSTNDYTFTGITGEDFLLKVSDYADNVLEYRIGKAPASGGGGGGSVKTTEQAITAPAVTAPVEAPSYTDIPSGAWYADAANFCASYGIISGVSEGQFGGSQNTQRGQIVTMLMRLENIKGQASATYQDGLFGDVKSGAYYADAVAWAAEHNIVKGMGTDASGIPNFGATQSVTREQLATILYNYAKYRNLDIKLADGASVADFQDAANISTYANDALLWAIQNGIITGSTKLDENGNQVLLLNPKGTATRAEIATMIKRLCEHFAII